MLNSLKKDRDLLYKQVLICKKLVMHANNSRFNDCGLIGESMEKSYHDVFKKIASVCLITGTCIGGGMLALPIAGGRIGFIPASIVMLLSWVFMTFTGLLYLEISTVMKKDAHISSMAADLLGPKGKVLSWLVYLFICYASLVAYVSEGGKLMGLFLSSYVDLSRDSLNFLYLSLFASLLVFSRKLLNSFNVTLLVCMFVSFFAIVIMGSQNFNGVFLLQQNWDSRGLLALFPLMLTTFSFPGIVPVIYNSHQGNLKDVRQIVFIGTTLTLVIYFIWFWIVLGSIPFTEVSRFEQSYENDNSIAVMLSEFVNNPTLGVMGQVFGFLAISTSFIGVGTALVHFL